MMTGPLDTLGLMLAQNQPWVPTGRAHEWSQVWPKALPSDYWTLAGVALGVTLLIAALTTGSSLLARLRQPAHSAAPLRLFLHVAGELGLTSAQKLALIRIARRQRLASPLTLLVCPQTFDHHVSQYLHALSPLSRFWVHRHIQSARLRLFS